MCCFKSRSLGKSGMYVCINGFISFSSNLAFGVFRCFYFSLDFKRGWVQLATVNGSKWVGGGTPFYCIFLIFLRSLKVHSSLKLSEKVVAQCSTFVWLNSVLHRCVSEQICERKIQHEKRLFFLTEKMLKLKSHMVWINDNIRVNI